MKLIQSALGRAPHPRPTVLTIGNFDGLHLGHRALVRSLIQISQAFRADPVVFTFVPHPKQVLFPERHFVRLFDFNDQKEQLEQMGVSVLVTEPFSRVLSETEPRRFLEDYIVTPFAPAALVVGHDFSFGHNRMGNVDEIRRILEPRGVKVVEEPAFQKDGEVVSSTRIRGLLAGGRAREAGLLLGRPFYLKGLVIRGVGRGSRISIPTANIEVDSFQAVPAQGVYATRSWVRGQSFPSVTNIGKNPTFEVSEKMKIETHILDFQGDIYGDTLRVEFLGRLRDEKSFQGVDELVSQIQRDIEQRRKRVE